MQAIKTRLQQQRHKAITAFKNKPKPEHLLRRLSTATDQALTNLLDFLPLPSKATVVAVGGYGRQELYPHSDVDVLILLAHCPNAADTELIEAYVAALWDSGLKAATSVRTIAQCLETAQADIATQTAQLEARFIAGNADLFEQLTQALQQQVQPQDYFQAKHAEMRQRHARYQNTPYALEPNCKESPGGLRDLHVLLWLAQAIGLGDSWQDIAQAQLLSSAELRAIRRANHAFMRLRIELHLLTRRAEDRLLFDYQPDLAVIYGLQREGESRQRASERLMQRYYWAARVVYQMNTLLMQSMEERLFSPTPPQCLPIDENFEIRNQRLHLRHPQALHHHPELIFKSLLALQQRSDITTLSAATLRALWHARRLIDESFRANPIHQQLFLQLLQQPRAVLQVLRLMNLLGLLPRYIPEFRHIVGQMQHDLFHVYTVDQHTLMVIRNLRRFTLPEYASETPLASELMADFDRPWVLYIAALFHDIAKGRGGNHAELGAHDARQFCTKHQLNAADTELVVFLVADHLSLSTVAQKRDSSDPEVIQHFIRPIPDARHLTALYLLTVADIKGTNPNIWNDWKAKLLNTLYRVSLRALEGDNPAPSVLLARRKAHALSQLLADGISQSDIDTLWSVLDISYFLRHDSEDIIWHGKALHKAVLYPKPLVKIRPVGQGKTLQLMLYTPDRSDLFVHICAFFEKYQLSIQDARIYTTNHGWALNSFVLLLPKHQRYETAYMDKLAQWLSNFIQHPHTLPIAKASGYARQQHSRRARAFPLVPTIDLQAIGSDQNKWKLSIMCADRQGLLLSIAQVFAAHRIDLQSAKIMTLGERVEDTFMIHSSQLHQTPFYQQFERDLYAAL